MSSPAAGAAWARAAGRRDTLFELRPGGEEIGGLGEGGCGIRQTYEGRTSPFVSLRVPEAGGNATPFQDSAFFPKHSVTRSPGWQMRIGAGRGHAIEEGSEDRGPGGDAGQQS